MLTVRFPALRFGRVDSGALTKRSRIRIDSLAENDKEFGGCSLRGRELHLAR